jgi:hypothetical protein
MHPVDRHSPRRRGRRTFQCCSDSSASGTPTSSMPDPLQCLAGIVGVAGVLAVDGGRSRLHSCARSSCSSGPHPSPAAGAVSAPRRGCGPNAVVDRGRQRGVMFIEVNAVEYLGRAAESGDQNRSAGGAANFVPTRSAAAPERAGPVGARGPEPRPHRTPAPQRPRGTTTGGHTHSGTEGRRSTPHHAAQLPREHP